jgi:hypothetical protein
MSVGGNIGSVPTFDLATFQPAAPIGGTEYVVVIVAFTAMTWTLNEIGAAVDLSTLVRIGREGLGLEKGRPPDTQALSNIEGESKF